MPHGPSSFSPTTVENPVFGPPVPGRGIVLRPPVRASYTSVNRKPPLRWWSHVRDPRPRPPHIVPRCDERRTGASWGSDIVESDPNDGALGLPEDFPQTRVTTNVEYRVRSNRCTMRVDHHPRRQQIAARTTLTRPRPTGIDPRSSSHCDRTTSLFLCGKRPMPAARRASSRRMIIVRWAGTVYSHVAVAGNRKSSFLSVPKSIT